MRHRYGLFIALTILAAVGVYLAGNHRVGLFDRDEPRYAQTSRQMLQSGDWIVPWFLDTVRTAKPIFIYWCQANSMRFLGVSEFAARLPSAIAMGLTLALLGIVIGRGIGPRRAAWTVFIVATCALATVAAKMCITDSVLLLWIVSAQLCLYAIYAGNRSRLVAIVLWVAVGMGGLTKGPVVLGFLLTTMLVLFLLDVRRGWRAAIGWWCHTRPLWGLLILVAIVGPWLYAIERHSPGFLRQTVLHDIWTRTIKPLEGHKGPPGFYLVAVWATWFPWSLLLPTAITLGWKNRRAGPVRFALAAVIGPWIMMELVQTKLVHYVMPTYPALAFLTADALVRCMRGRHEDLRRPAIVIAAGVWAVLATFAAAVPWIAHWRLGPLPGELYPAMIAVSAVGALYAWLVFALWRWRWIAPAAIAMGAGMMLFVTVFYAVYLPRAGFLWVPRRVAEVLQREGATRPGQVVMIDYKEDSLAFYQGGTIRARDDDFLAVTSPEEWPEWIVLTEEIRQKLPAERARRLRVVDRVRGWAYADGGRRVEVLIARRAP